MQILPAKPKTRKILIRTGLALLILNEIRGIIVVGTVGWPMLKAMLNLGA